MFDIIKEQDRFKDVLRKSELYAAFKNKDIFNFFKQSESIEEIEKYLLENNNIIGGVFFNSEIATNNFNNSSKLLILKNEDYTIRLLRNDFNNNTVEHILKIEINLKEELENLFKLSVIKITNSNINREYLNKIKDVIYPKVELSDNSITIENNFMTVKDENNKRLSPNVFLSRLQEDHTSILSYFTIEKENPINGFHKLVKKIENDKYMLKLILEKSNVDINIDNLYKKENYIFFKSTPLIKSNSNKEIYIIKNIKENINSIYMKEQWAELTLNKKSDSVDIRFGNVGNETKLYITDNSFENQKKINISSYTLNNEEIELSNNRYDNNSFYYPEYVKSPYSEDFISHLEDISEKENNGMISPIKFIDVLSNLLIEMKALTLEEFINNDFIIKKESLDLINLMHDVNVNDIEGFSISFYRSNSEIIQKNGIKNVKK